MSFQNLVIDDRNNKKGMILGLAGVGALGAGLAIYLNKRNKDNGGGGEAGPQAKGGMRAGNGPRECGTDAPMVPMIMTSDRGGATNTQVDPTGLLRQDRRQRSVKALAIHDPMEPGNLADILPSCESDSLLTHGLDPRLPSSYMADTMVAVLPKSKLSHDPFLGDNMVEAPRRGHFDTRFRTQHLRPGLFGGSQDNVAAVMARRNDPSIPTRNAFEAMGV